MEKVYYIGFNAGNAIGNENFFEGSITIYPTNEKGNIHYLNKFSGEVDIRSEEFLQAYKKFVYATAKSIQQREPNCRFIYFNLQIKKLLCDADDLNIVDGNDEKLLSFLNDKFAIRDFVKSDVPILDYILVDGGNLDFYSVRKQLGCNEFVVQTQNGAGGNGTYFVDCPEKLLCLKKRGVTYCISKYESHIPINVTLVIGEEQILFLPLSVQLISKSDGTFKYVGADFIYPKTFNDATRIKIYDYCGKIANRIRDLGYRGVLGIDYILCEREQVKFMEINPRLQSSSFLISHFLREHNTSIAQLHYMALMGHKLLPLGSLEIDKSFVNCSARCSFDGLKNFEVINAGYFKENPQSLYRKVFGYSIFTKGEFEQMQGNTNKMKICLVSEEYPDETNFGGIATYQKRLAVALTNLGHHVTVIARSLDSDKKYSEDGIDIIRIVKHDTGNLIDDYSNYRMRVCKILKGLADRNLIDILEVPDWGAEAIFFSRQKKIPMVVKMHTPLCIWTKFNKSGLGEKINQQMLEWEKESVERADKVISCTQILKDMLYPAMNLDSGVDIEVVPNPANTKDFYPVVGCHESKNILYCGSLEQRKGVDILARAVGEVIRRLQDDEIKFIFVGKDTTRNDKNISMVQYIKHVVPAEYHRNLIFVGQVNNSELNAIYNDARIGVVPSRFDNLPYVAMEQMLTQMPIIASCNTGVREMITDEISGLLYEPLDYMELAEKIIYMYQNPQIAKRMGEEARRVALEKYSPEVIAKKMESIYLAEIEKYKTKSMNFMMSRAVELSRSSKLECTAEMPVVENEETKEFILGV